MKPQILVIMLIMLGLGVTLTMQSVTAQPLPVKTDFCLKFPKACDGILSFCDKHPEICTKVVQTERPLLVIPPDPGCQHCPEKVILDVNPGELFVVGQLNNSTVAVKVSPQDIMQMLSNVTSNIASNLAK